LRVKVVRGIDREVLYDDSHWELLKSKRERGVDVLKALKNFNIQAYIYGSVARGDVHKDSDVDVIIPYMINPFIIELVVEEKFGNIYAKEIVRATPKHALKGHIYIDSSTTISFPLTPFSRLEQEFYKFGGLIGLPEGEDYRNRVPGVDKRLVLILPTDNGHKEISILGREEWVAKILDVSIDIVKERKHVLMRRDEVGRTGIYLKRTLDIDESFDRVLKELIDKDPSIKRMLRSRKK